MTSFMDDPNTKIALNNKTDKIRLFSFFGQILSFNNKLSSTLAIPNILSGLRTGKVWEPVLYTEDLARLYFRPFFLFQS